MEIVIEGSRSSREDWQRAQALPVDQLPALSPVQKQAAAELRIAEESYARSATASELSSVELKGKARVLGEWINRQLRETSVSAQVSEIRLATFEGMFQVRMQTPFKNFVLRIEEELVDRWLETGSEQAELQLRRILDLHAPRAAAS